MVGSPLSFSTLLIRVSTDRLAGLHCSGYENDTIRDTQILAAVITGTSNYVIVNIQRYRIGVRVGLSEVKDFFLDNIAGDR